MVGRRRGKKVEMVEKKFCLPQVNRVRWSTNAAYYYQA